MKKLNNIFTFKFLKLALFICLIASESFSQENNSTFESKSLNKLNQSEEKNKNLTIEKVKKGIEALIAKKSSGSLMYDEEQSENILRAVESLKNNETYIPENFGELEPSEEDLQAQAAAEAEKRAKENEKSYIYLASIIHISKNQWVVWLNDKKITSQDNSPENEFYLSKVTRNLVDVVWKLSVSKWKILSGNSSEEFAPKINDDNQVEVKFSLKPNQTYVLKSDKIVEGRGIIDQIRENEEDKLNKARSIIGGTL